MLRLIIVEDDPMVRMINERFVAKISQFELVASVSSLDEAKQILATQSIHLVLLDVFLPSGSGLDLLKWIRDEALKCDVILITAENRLESIQEAFRYGAVDYLIKPFNFQRFQEALKNYERRSQLLKGESLVEQAIIDQYLIGIKEEEEQSSSKKTEVPLRRGLNINTYEQILMFMKTIGQDLSAEEIAYQVGLARVTVRRYLDYLVQEGELKLIRVYGKIGRPTHLYRYTKQKTG